MKGLIMDETIILPKLKLVQEILDEDIERKIKDETLQAATDRSFGGLMNLYVMLDYDQDTRVYEFEEGRTIKGIDLVMGRLVSLTLCTDSYERRLFCLGLRSAELIQVKGMNSYSSYRAQNLDVPVEGIEIWKSREL